MVYFSVVLFISMYYAPFNVLILSPLIILSIGMFYLRKWAAAGISLLCCFFAFLLFEVAIETRKPATWPGFIAGFLLMIPGVLTVTQWRVLVWRAKQDGRDFVGQTVALRPVSKMVLGHCTCDPNTPVGSEPCSIHNPEAGHKVD